MEDNFQSHNPSFGISQDPLYRPNYLETGYRNNSLLNDQPFTKIELKPLPNSGPKPNEPPQFYFNVNEFHPKPYLETSQPNQNPNPQFQFNFLSGLDKFKKLLSPKDEDESGAIHSIPDEKKDVMNLTAYSGMEEWRPSALLRGDNGNRSQSPIDVRSKGNTSSRPSYTRSPTPNISAKKKPLDEQNTSRNESPTRRLNRYGSSERYFEAQTEKIFQKEPEHSRSPLSKKSSISTKASPQKGNKSALLDSSMHSISYSPLKKSAKMDSLKSIKLEGSPNVERKAKAGIGAVRETLDDVLRERDEMKAIVEKLKNAMREEKAALEKSQENIRFLANHTQCLSKRSGNLDQNTVNVQGLVNRLREETKQLEGEVEFCSGMVMRINKQAEIEKELIKLNEQNIKALRAQLSQDSKERDNLKGKAEVSRHDRKKSMEKYQNATNTQKNIIYTLESQFQRYAA